MNELLRREVVGEGSAGRGKGEKEREGECRDRACPVAYRVPLWGRGIDGERTAASAGEIGFGGSQQRNFFNIPSFRSLPGLSK